MFFFKHVEGVRPMLPSIQDAADAPVHRMSVEEMYSTHPQSRSASRNSAPRHMPIDDFYTDVPREGGVFRRSSSRRSGRRSTDDEW